MKYIEVNIETLTLDGKGVGSYNNKKCYVIGGLPKEKVLAEIIKQKKDYIEALFVKLIENPNPNRLLPQEPHYLSTSHLQIIPYEEQLKLKKKNIKVCFQKFAKEKITKLNFKKSPIQWGYRNKIEFSFYEENDILHLAFHKRGSYKDKIPLPQGSKLGHPKINETALDILNILRQLKIKAINLKSLVVRYSYFENKTITLLLFKERLNYTKEFLIKINQLINVIESDNQINNITVGYSLSNNPKATISNLIFKKGETILVEKINNLYFNYTIDDFFQNNITLFSKTLKTIEKFINKNDTVLELYGGVGCIGLAIASKAKLVKNIEINKTSVEMSLINAKINNIKNYDAICLQSEEVPDELFMNIDVLILDPPRTGLHKKVRKKIIANKPKRIIYLSCNPITQASDYNLLKELYEISYIKGFDFYPQTHHIENLLVLNLKNRNNRN